jgi:hypothetical protein
MKPRLKNKGINHQKRFIALFSYNNKGYRKNVNFLDLSKCFILKLFFKYLTNNI